MGGLAAVVMLQHHNICVANIYHCSWSEQPFVSDMMVGLVEPEYGVPTLQQNYY
jgi:hypothetical protein